LKRYANDGWSEVVKNWARTLGPEGLAQLPASFRALMVREFVRLNPSASNFLSMAAECFKAGMLWPAYAAASTAHEMGDADAHLILREVLRPPPPQMATVEITTACNLRCPHCALQHTPEDFPTRQMMSLADFRRVWSAIGLPSTLVVVGQGETLLHPHWREIVAHARMNGARTALVDTNGSFPMDADALVESGLTRIIFSIDGVDQASYERYRVGGDFALALGNLRATVAAARRIGPSAPQIGWKFIMFRHLEHRRAEAAALAKDIGVHILFEPPTVKGARTPAEAAEWIPDDPRYHRGEFWARGRLYPAARRTYPHCTVPLTQVDVLVDGSVKFCCAASRSVSIGNAITAEDFIADCWHSDAAVELRRLALEDRRTAPACDGCSMAFAHHGSYLAGTPWADADEDPWSVPADERVSIVDLLRRYKT